jgi:NAD(P)-dependent dehydrogenase (short-subunit alcohol dehydrogenase family)
VLAPELLRPGLLEGASVLVAGATEPGAPFGIAVREACTGLGARVSECRAISDRLDFAEEAAMDEEVKATLAGAGRIDLLVVDCAGLFALGGLRACLDATWNVTRAVASLAFLPTEPSLSPRRIVYLAPAPDAGEYADAARAGLENLARTLSIEWARHAITIVTVAPGEETPAGEVAALTAYLASPAGAYFSGCLLDLRGP